MIICKKNHSKGSDIMNNLFDIKNCPQCGRSIENGISVCSYCGYKTVDSNLNNNDNKGIKQLLIMCCQITIPCLCIKIMFPGISFWVIIILMTLGIITQVKRQKNPNKKENKLVITILIIFFCLLPWLFFFMIVDGVTPG